MVILPLSVPLVCMMSCSADEYRHAVDAHGKGQKFILRYHGRTRNGELLLISMIQNVSLKYIFHMTNVSVCVAFSQDSDTSLHLKVAMVIELMDYIITHTSVNIIPTIINVYLLLVMSCIDRAQFCTILESPWIYYKVCAFS